LSAKKILLSGRLASKALISLQSALRKSSLVFLPLRLRYPMSLKTSVNFNKLGAETRLTATAAELATKDATTF
jgi:hypothetical protein